MARPLAPKALRQPRSGSPAEDRARAEQGHDLAPVLGAQLLRAVRVGEITIATGQTKDVPHGLGAAPQDWFLTSPRTFGRVKEISRTRDVLRLEADLGQTATLWVVPA